MLSVISVNLVATTTTPKPKAPAPWAAMPARRMPAPGMAAVVGAIGLHVVAFKKQFCEIPSTPFFFFYRRVVLLGKAAKPTKSPPLAPAVVASAMRSR